MYLPIIVLWVGLIVFDVYMLFIQIFGERDKGIMALCMFAILFLSIGIGALIAFKLLGIK